MCHGPRTLLSRVVAEGEVTKEIIVSEQGRFVIERAEQRMSLWLLFARPPPRGTVKGPLQETVPFETREEVCRRVQSPNHLLDP